MDWKITQAINFFPPKESFYSVLFGFCFLYNLLFSYCFYINIVKLCTNTKGFIAKPKSRKIGFRQMFLQSILVTDLCF